MKHISVFVAIGVLVFCSAGGARSQSIVKYCSVAGFTSALQGGLTLSGSIGQAVIGRVAVAEREASQGFWSGSAHGAHPSRIIGTVPAGLNLLSNAPNPFTGETTIRFSLAAATDVMLHVVDVRGTIVESRRISGRSAGDNEYRFLAGALPPGTYTYRLTDGTWSKSGTMTILR